MKLERYEWKFVVFVVSVPNVILYATFFGAVDAFLHVIVHFSRYIILLYILYHILFYC